MKKCLFRSFRCHIGFLIVFSNCCFSFAQDYEVADIDCAVGTGGKELLTARLRRPEGFRGTPIFADDRGSPNNPLTSPRDPASLIAQEILNKDTSPCQIFPDTLEPSGRVFKLRVTDFSQCGVLKRNGFIHVRVWFPQLPGVVMLSDQEVIIMCKPPAATIVQSKTAGFAGSIPSGARVSGIVEESPGRLEYEVALYRETSPSMAARSSSSSTTAAMVTGIDAHELPVDQAVPIGTRLQLRAKINHESAWKHAKLMEVSVSPDPKNPNAEGSVSLVRDGCRNADLASIIPKQPYRYKERSNEVVLDFEAFLLSNMGDRSTLWLHTQIKACMESQDCQPEFCMDVYHPSAFGKKRRRRRSIGPAVIMTSGSSGNNNPNNGSSTGMEYSAPLSQHWRTIAEDIILDNKDEDNVEEGDKPEHRMLEKDIFSILHLNSTEKSSSSPQKLVDIGSLQLAKNFAQHQHPIPQETVVVSSDGFTQRNVHKEDIDTTVHKYLTRYPSSTSPSLQDSSTIKTTVKSSSTSRNNNVKHSQHQQDEKETAKFGDNIGFSVIMPSDYYRSSQVLSTSLECKGWATAALVSLLVALFTGVLACGFSYKLRRNGGSDKEKGLYPFHGGTSIHPIRTNKDPSGGMILDPSKQGDSRHLKYARDPSIYRS